MDASRAREQLRRRYLFSPQAEAALGREGHAGLEASTAVEKKEKPLPRLNIHSGFWILASIVVTYYVDFFKTVRENFHASSWFLFGGALLLISLSVAFYCILYLECRNLLQHRLMARVVVFHSTVVIYPIYGGRNVDLTPWMISRDLRACQFKTNDPTSSYS
ncbi:Transmembrane protein 128 [Manis javanica]|nr:Transmembrane protein 128 [Manis javanica]